jgi:TP901 family phage tail tape measure protein
VLALSGETAKAPKELADALFVITSAGVRGAGAMEILEQASKASAIGLGETNVIARALTAVLQAYAGTGLTAAQATDQLVATIREGNLEASSLAPSLGRVIGIAANLGVSFGEVGANIATFTRLGVSAEQAITGLSGVLRAAMRPSEQAKQQLEGMGLSASFLRDTIQKDGLASALVQLNTLFKGNSEGLGMVIPEIEALSNVLGVAGAQADNYIKIQENLINANGLVDDGFERVSETAGFKFNKALTDLSVAGVKMGDTLVPIIENITRIVSELAIKYSQLSEGVKSFITILLSTGAVIGPVIYAVGKLTLGIKALTLAMASNPYTALAIGLLAIGTAAFIAFDGINDVTKKVRESIGLSSKLTGSQEEYNKILAEQNKIRNQIKPIDDQLAEGDLSPGQIQALMRTKAEYVKNQNAVKELGREWYRARDAGIELAKSAKESAAELERLEELLGGTTTELVAQEGSTDALNAQLKDLQAQMGATGDSIKRAQLAHQIRGITSEIERLERMTDPVEEVAIGIQKLSTASFARGQLPLAQLPQHIIDMNNELRQTALLTEVMDFSINLARDSMLQFTNLAIQGFADLVVNGGKVIDMLENIGRIVLSGAIQMILKYGLFGAAGFGIKGGSTGLIGKFFAASVMGGDIGTVTPASASLTLDGQFQIRGTDLVYVMNRAERSLR